MKNHCKGQAKEKVYTESSDQSPKAGDLHLSSSKGVSRNLEDEMDDAGNPHKKIKLEHCEDPHQKLNKEEELMIKEEHNHIDVTISSTGPAFNNQCDRFEVKVENILTFLNTNRHLSYKIDGFILSVDHEAMNNNNLLSNTLDLGRIFLGPKPNTDVKTELS